MIEVKGKDDFVAELHSQIDDASRKIDELRLQTDLATKEAQTAFDERIGQLEKERDRVRKQIADLKNCAEDASEELTKGCQQSWEVFKDSLGDAMKKFKN